MASTCEEDELSDSSYGERPHDTQYPHDSFRRRRHGRRDLRCRQTSAADDPTLRGSRLDRTPDGPFDTPRREPSPGPRRPPGPPRLPHPSQRRLQASDALDDPEPSYNPPRLPLRDPPCDPPRAPYPPPRAPFRNPSRDPSRDPPRGRFRDFPPDPLPPDPLRNSQDPLSSSLEDSPREPPREPPRDPPQDPPRSHFRDPPRIPRPIPPRFRAHPNERLPANPRFRSPAEAAALDSGLHRFRPFGNMATSSQAPAVTTESPASPTQGPTRAAAEEPASSTSAAAEAPATRSTTQQQPGSNVAPQQTATASAPTQAAPSTKDGNQNVQPATSSTARAVAPAATTQTPAAATSTGAAPVAGATTATQPEKETPGSSIVTITPSDTATSVQIVTSTTTQAPTGASSTSAATSTSTATPIDASSDGSTGLSQSAKVAIGVVVPIAAIALLAVLGLFWWKKRRARQEAEEERRKEVEDYAYNPNADPTIPSAGHSADHSYEMREDGGVGYRGWGSTAAAGSSMGRKPSTTLSGGGGGMVGMAYSDPLDPASPTRGNPEARSGEPLLDGSYSPEGEILGVMGPSAANNRGGDMRRGPSNASSSYSMGARSEGSDGGMYGNGSNYYDQYGQNPYTDQRSQDPASQAVIRDNPALRNPRIENTSHYPQQSAGIAQNF